MANAIEFDNISKQYHLGRVGSGTLSHDLNRWWTVNVLHKEDPYLRIGETNDRSVRGNSDYVWALKDISFNVQQGDVVGIIGKNGAGKSTLLKLLSKVTAPTTGEIRTLGRIGTLLEVGTGFHPEMTGRENIYMNGAILGMSKREISSKLDEIIDFSGCERYIDTPVKRYSSGMTVRLGFAVAAHLDPEILVVDEVLAVGDAEFQKKAIGKMKDVAQGQGRTVLFVSHNMAAVRNLCSRGIVLNNGQMVYDGDVTKAIDLYNTQTVSITGGSIVDAITLCADYLHIDYISFNGTENRETTIVSNQPTVKLVIKGHTGKAIDAEPKVIFKTSSGIPVMAYAEGRNLGKWEHINGDFTISRTIELPAFLAKGEYILDIWLHKPQVMDYMCAANCINMCADGNHAAFGHPVELHGFGVIGLTSTERKQ